MEALMRRKFSEVGDVERAYRLMGESSALAQTEATPLSCWPPPPLPTSFCAWLHQLPW